MPAPTSPSAHAAAQRVLRTTANAWRLKAPARARVRGRVSPAAGAGRCAVRFGFPLAGYGLAISY